MTARTELENRIAREQQKVAAMRSELERTEAFIEGLLEALKMLPKDIPNLKHSGNRTSRSRSDVQKARQLLGATRGPLHISDILKGIGKEDTKQNRASLSSSLARYARKGELFQREGPNEFSLMTARPDEEANTARDVQNEMNPQLPPTFGSDRG